MAQRLKRTCLALFMILLTGCSYPDYPKTWPAVAQGSVGCSGITGIYQNSGQVDSSPYSVPKLEVVLLQKLTPEVEEVSLIQREDSLIVEALAKGKVVGQTSYSEADGTFNCDHGVATLKMPAGDQRGNPLVGVQWSNITLARAENGDLICSRNSGGAGMVYMFLPAAYGERIWFRFYQAKS